MLSYPWPFLQTTAAASRVLFTSGQQHHDVISLSCSSIGLPVSEMTPRASYGLRITASQCSPANQAALSYELWCSPNADRVTPCMTIWDLGTDAYRAKGGGGGSASWEFQRKAQSKDLPLGGWWILEQELVAKLGQLSRMIWSVGLHSSTSAFNWQPHVVACCICADWVLEWELHCPYTEDQAQYPYDLSQLWRGSEMRISASAKLKWDLSI